MLRDRAYCLEIACLPAGRLHFVRNDDDIARCRSLVTRHTSQKKAEISPRPYDGMLLYWKLSECERHAHLNRVELGTLALFEERCLVPGGIELEVIISYPACEAVP